MEKILPKPFSFQQSIQQRGTTNAILCESLQSRNNSTFMCTGSGFMLRTEHSSSFISESTMRYPQDRTTNILVSILHSIPKQADPLLFCVRQHLYLVISVVMSKLRVLLLHLFWKSKVQQFLDASGEHVLLFAKSCKQLAKTVPI